MKPINHFTQDDIQRVREESDKSSIMRVTKVDSCPICKIVSPPLTVSLKNPQRYESSSDIPDKREYDLVCLNCGNILTTFEVDNHLAAIKELRDAMDKAYGPSKIYPSWL